MSLARHLSAWVAALWAGSLLGIGLIAAPSLFAVLDRAAAGQVAARMFQVEAYVSLGLAMLLILFERSQARQGSARPGVLLLLMLGVLFCTVFGYFGLQPTMQAARAGAPGWLSFGAAHGLSTVLFGLKGVLIAWYAWRAQRP